MLDRLDRSTSLALEVDEPLLDDPLPVAARVEPEAAGAVRVGPLEPADGRRALVDEAGDEPDAGDDRQRARYSLGMI